MSSSFLLSIGSSRSTSAVNYLHARNPPSWNIIRMEHTLKLSSSREHSIAIACDECVCANCFHARCCSLASRLFRIYAPVHCLAAGAIVLSNSDNLLSMDPLFYWVQFYSPVSVSMRNIPTFDFANNYYDALFGLFVLRDKCGGNVIGQFPFWAPIPIRDARLVTQSTL